MKSGEVLEVAEERVFLQEGLCYTQLFSQIYSGVTETLLKTGSIPTEIQSRYLPK